MSAEPDAEVEKPHKIRWEKDGSMRVLVNWLRTPGNYKCWRGGFQKAGKRRHDAVNSISAQLKKQGIWRSNPSIYGKLNLLEENYAQLFEWLHENQISVDDVLNGSADVDLLLKVKGRCPHYRELLSVFRPFFVPSDSSHDVEDTTNAESEEKRQAASEDNLASSPVTEYTTNAESEKKRRAANQDDLAPSKRRRTGGPSDQVDISETQSGGASVSDRSVTCGFQYSSQSWRYDRRTVDVQQPVACPPEVQQQLGGVVVHHAERRSDLQLKAEERGEHLRFRMQLAQAVNQMKKDGISDDILDRYLPQGG
ncbi:hypothetical protein PF005_g4253 [Phytophthora fragariae]|uniref:Uncharacterized protein n=1 Tax=Phytophthora fragariae TaxID=53985 RepID=A0A6A3FK73_9STRA|nr:hypothetical protein PF003_g19266 [Phytophthora fragariae]KAE8945612.1 hypothetical protein PF009_g4728 [Phytophthora fragariae]KAE9024753.1 hypothetical protein PF011_g3343 [Phytophthora fragariae]KAE9130837.1 hypothetical protein PF007_g4347 [Phytophthora fragariae]KAE9131008.1 hypothetical protein PF010_g3645 [Phytophthora fragariae]